MGSLPVRSRPQEKNSRQEKKKGRVNESMSTTSKTKKKKRFGVFFRILQLQRKRNPYAGYLIGCETTFEGTRVVVVGGTQARGSAQAPSPPQTVVGGHLPA